MESHGSDVPMELNWVKARAECSLAQVFKALELAIKDDIEAVNSLTRVDAGTKFALVPYGGKRFSVVCEVNHFPSGSIDFSLSETEILVGCGADTIFRARLTLTDSGRCKLKLRVNGTELELEQWQFRRKALEDLFFDKNRASL
jgi:hypothetical protein